MGHFAVTPTPKSKAEIETENNSNNLGIQNLSNAEKSRRFSKLPPAAVDSPNAVKLGSKFTMISREADKINEN